MPERIRCFIAFDVEEGDVLQNIKRAQDAFEGTGADLKLVELQNLHVTLRFLGEISLVLVDRVREELQRVRFESFDIGLRGVGAFPTAGWPNVIWIGIEEGVPALTSIFNQVEAVLRRLGFPPDKKGFSPHLTIARVRSARNRAELTKQITAMADLEFGTVKARCLRLKRSTLTSRGPIYSTLEEFPASDL